MDTIENLKAAAGAEGPIRAGEVLDEKSWEARPWHERRETPPDDQPFCDIAASQVLAQMAALGGEMPKEQSFLAQSGGELLGSQPGLGILGLGVKRRVGRRAR